MRIDDANVMLRLVPEHTRTSCSDENPINHYTTDGRRGYPRCTRCLLMAIASGKVTEEVSPEIQVRYEVYSDSERDDLRPEGYY